MEAFGLLINRSEFMKPLEKQTQYSINVYAISVSISIKQIVRN